MIERAERERTTRPRKVTDYNDDSELLLKQVGEIFNISDIIGDPQEEPQIMSYYWANKLTYKFGYNWDLFSAQRNQLRRFIQEG